MTSTRLLRRHEVQSRCSVSKSTLYALLQNGAFPRPIKLSPNRVAWLEGEIDDWIAARAGEREPTSFQGRPVAGRDGEAS